MTTPIVKNIPLTGVSQGDIKKEEPKIELYKLPEFINNITSKSFRENLYSLNVMGKNFGAPFLIIFALVYFTSYQVYLGFKDDESSSHFIKYVYLIIVPVILLFCYIIHLTFDPSAEYSIFAMLAIVAIVLLILWYAFAYVKIEYSRFAYVSYGMLFLIIIVGLMFVYNVFEKRLREFDNWTGFILNLIFYIPCMVDMFFKYLIKDYINTPNWISILFIAEIGLILLYYYLIPWLKKQKFSSGVQLLHSPVMLNEVHSEMSAELRKSLANRILDPYYIDVANSTKEMTSYVKRAIEESEFRKNYAISMWIYVNPMSTSRIGYSEESNIFTYGIQGIGLDPASYHPKVSMLPTEDGHQLAIYYAGDKYTNTIEIPYQKWNNLLFNYREGGVDLFLNGKIKYTYSYATHELPKYYKSDQIISGDTDELEYNNGLYGAICNIMYFKNPLSKREIVNNYNEFVYKNPPI